MEIAFLYEYLAGQGIVKQETRRCGNSKQKKKMFARISLYLVDSCIIT